MLYRLIQRTCFFLIFLMLLHPFAAQAGAGAAFAFAERKEWRSAIGQARKSGDQALLRLMMWQYLLDPDSGAAFEDVTGFIARWPHWPAMNRLQVRAELSLRNSVATDRELLKWFEDNPPVTGLGKFRYAEALTNNGASLGSEKVSFLIRDAWKNGDFTEDEEDRFLALYRNELHKDDHIARADRLLWEEKTKPVSRMMHLLPDDEQQLARARIALIANDRNPNDDVAKVPGRLRSNPGLIYARMQWRAARGDDDGVQELLLDAPETVPYPEKWWKLRETQVRRAIDMQQYEKARRLLKNHGQTSGTGFADATWLSGWLSLRFLKNPQDAYIQFYRMTKEVNAPVSKARAAYWAARASDAMGDKETAKSWYESASVHATTFYGQLASAALGGGKPLDLPDEPTLSAQARKAFAGNDVALAARLALQQGANDTATTLINHLIDNAANEEEAALAVKLAAEARGDTLAVRGAKRALQQKGVMLPATGYPRVHVPNDAAVEPALALAVARQESEFDPRARSSAGAVGLMQLLPSSAKEIARKMRIAYHATRLTEPAYNLRLGTEYLARLINAYGHSYIQALAAYNAGPSRVRGWLGEFGEPGETVEEAVDWIEKIPYAETRNYVQRVIENTQIYRHRLARKSPPALQITQDLTR